MQPAADNTPGGAARARRRRAGRLLGWTLRISALLALGVVAFYWGALTPRVLLRHDRTGLEPGEPADSMPIDNDATLATCLGPPGWIVALGVIGLAFLTAALVQRWPWPLRVLIAAAPALALLWLFSGADLRPDVRPILLQIAVVEIVLAALVALCAPRLIGRLRSMCAEAEPDAARRQTSTLR